YRKALQNPVQQPAARGRTERKEEGGTKEDGEAVRELATCHNSLPDQMIVPDGLEPSLPARHAGVFAAGPRDHDGRPGRSPAARKATARRGVWHPACKLAERAYQRSLLRFGVCKLSRSGKQAITSRAVTEVGVEPTDTHQALDLAAFPVCVLARQIADSGVAPDLRAYETQMNAGPSALK